MMIPYASRTVDVILHPDCPLPKKGAKDVINLLKVRELSSVIEAVVQISPERYRFTFNNARQMQAFSNQDFFVHGKPVEFRSVSPFTWVYISRLSYGIPDEAITRALAPYSGGIKTMKSVVHENIYTGEHNVLMKITANIPARLRIAGHWCVVKYSGQKPVCFKCHKEGHVIADCPSYRAALAAYNGHPNGDAATASGNTETEPAVSATPALSYAAIAGSNLPANTSESAGSSTPGLTNNSNIHTAPACVSDAPAPASSASSAPSGRGSTVAADHSSSQPSSPARRRGKRRHSPSTSPQPEEKRATPEDEVVGAPTALSDPVHKDPGPDIVPLPTDTDDDDDDDNNNTDLDDEHNRNTDMDGDDEIDVNEDNDVLDDDSLDDASPDAEFDNDNDAIGDDNESQHSGVDQMDPAHTLDLGEDDYQSDDETSFATVSEAELPNSPAPHPVRLSPKRDTRPVTRDESAGAVAHDADALFKLAAVLPTQGGSPSF